MEILVSILGLLFKGIFSFLSSSAESSAKSEAKAANARADQALESVESERAIEKAVREVDDVYVDPNDIFGAVPAADPTGGVM
jgi:hypothetical protein